MDDVFWANLIHSFGTFASANTASRYVHVIGHQLQVTNNDWFSDVSHIVVSELQRLVGVCTGRHVSS